LTERSFGFNAVLLIFFQPVHLHFQLADLLAEIGNQVFFACGLLTSVRRKQLGQPIQYLLFPLRNLGRMHAIFGGALIGGFVSLDGF